MDADFWHQRWNENNIAFHEGHPNALLKAHVDRLALKPQSRLFVPLCGKANDLAWLAGCGHLVVGIELSEKAVTDAFSGIGATPTVTEIGSFRLFEAGGIALFVGDLFELSSDVLGPVDAIYDRAALVALPAQMRRTYAAHLPILTGTAPQLLITYEYDQSQTDGPPFSVTGEEIGDLYGARYHHRSLARVAIAGPLAARCSGYECAWLLEPR